ncbi:MAG: hypothetical protein B7Z55_15320 [Planctomycetales bacterium 12-60-4]|nr:MAG: hypothetical protein B7Z55_15320 [Planctomycetales bacterium 12-60-4]
MAEWCQDWYDPLYYHNSPRENPVGPETGVYRVNRGGYWVNSACIWSYYRMRDKPKDALDALGLRLVLSVDAVKQAVQKHQATRWHGWPVDAPPPAIAPFNAALAKQHQEEWAAYLKVPVEYTNSIGMKFRLVTPGEFLMGSTPEEIEAALQVAGENAETQERIHSEGPQHKVVLTQPVYVGVTVVTQSRHEQIMGTNPSHFSATGERKDAVANLETGNHPVEMVSWNDAAEFCRAGSCLPETCGLFNRCSACIRQAGACPTGLRTIAARLMTPCTPDRQNPERR